MNFYYEAVFFHAPNLFFFRLASSKALLIHQFKNYVFLISNLWEYSSGITFYPNLCPSRSNLRSVLCFNSLIRSSKIIISEILLHLHINKILNSSLFIFLLPFLHFPLNMNLFIHCFLTPINMHIFYYN